MSASSEEDCDALRASDVGRGAHTRAKTQASRAHHTGADRRRPGEAGKYSGHVCGSAAYGLRRGGRDRGGPKTHALISLGVCRERCRLLPRSISLEVAGAGLRPALLRSGGVGRNCPARMSALRRGLHFHGFIYHKTGAARVRRRGAVCDGAKCLVSCFHGKSVSIVAGALHDQLVAGNELIQRSISTVFCRICSLAVAIPSKSFFTPTMSMTCAGVAAPVDWRLDQ